MYRLYAAGDHMDSPSPAEGIYQLQGPLGYPWRQGHQPPGTEHIYRGYYGATGDHALQSPFYDYGYSREYLGLYGYPRYGGLTSLQTLAGSKVSVTSNRATGGQVWQIASGGKDYLVNTASSGVLDTGRGTQASLQFPGLSALPTEGGDSQNHADPALSHGSPMAHPIQQTANQQITTAIPLEWDAVSYGGGPNVPVIYPHWRLGKRVTVDTVDLGPGFSAYAGQVVRYDTRFSNPAALSPMQIEIPASHVTPDLYRGFAFDATQGDINSGTTSLAEHLGDDNHHQYNLPTSGGLIVTDQTATHAYGIYGSRRPSGSEVGPIGQSVDYMVIHRFADTTKITSVWGPGALPAGDHMFTTYICIGTFDEVRTMMRRLYLMGYR